MKDSEDSHLALLAYMTATQGFSLMASVKRSRAFCRSPARKKMETGIKNHKLNPILSSVYLVYQYRNCLCLNPPSPRALIAAIFFSLAWSIISSVTWGNVKSVKSLVILQAWDLFNKLLTVLIKQLWKSGIFYLNIVSRSHVLWFISIWFDHSLLVDFWKSKQKTSPEFQILNAAPPSFMVQKRK